MSINGDDPAFPMVCDGVDGMEFVIPGLTKREDFAKAAMVGILSSWGGEVAFDKNWIGGEAVRLADALIAALNEEPKP